MSATLARQGGRVQLEQSDMRLALNMAKIATGWFSCAAIEETQQLMKKCCAKVQEEKKWGVRIPGHHKVKVAIESHPAMVYKNQIDRCLPCQNGTAKNPQTCWRRKGAAAPPPDLAASPPGRPPPLGAQHAPQGEIDGYESQEIQGIPTLSVYIHSSHPNSPFFNHNAYAKDSKRD